MLLYRKGLLVFQQPFFLKLLVIFEFSKKYHGFIFHIYNQDKINLKFIYLIFSINVFF